MAKTKKTTRLTSTRKSTASQKKLQQAYGHAALKTFLDFKKTFVMLGSSSQQRHA